MPCKRHHCCNQQNAPRRYHAGPPPAVQVQPIHQVAPLDALIPMGLHSQVLDMLKTSHQEAQGGLIEAVRGAHSNSAHLIQIMQAILLKHLPDAGRDETCGPPATNPDPPEIPVAGNPFLRNLPDPPRLIAGIGDVGTYPGSHPRNKGK